MQLPLQMMIIVTIAMLVDISFVTACNRKEAVGLSLVNTGPTEGSQLFVLKKGDQNKVPSNENGDGELNVDYAVRLREFLPDQEASHPYFSFDRETLGDCGYYPYGFLAPAVAPCFYLKLNKVSGWVPKPIDEEDLSDPDFPPALADHWHTQRDKNNVWIHCDGMYPADKEALRDMEYFPASRAIPVKYFPSAGESSDQIYHSPLVAIKIRPHNTEQLIHVECRAYAKEKMEAVQFGVLIKEHGQWLAN